MRRSRISVLDDEAPLSINKYSGEFFGDEEIEREGGM